MEEGQPSYTGIGNIQVLEDLYNRFLEDPNSVDHSWRHFFEGMEFALVRPGRREMEAPSDHRIAHLILSYRTYGHLLAKVNVIDAHPVSEVPQLKLEMLGFKDEELDQSFPTCGLMENEEASLREIIDRLQQIYCRGIGFEYMGLQRSKMEAWLQERIEVSRPELSIDQKKTILGALNQAELFETFLNTKYVGQKRFSLEGGEALIPILQELIDVGADTGMEEFVIGMAHRGRLNVLVNILNKSYGEIFHEFEDVMIESSIEGSGDVKYHKGFSSDVESTSGKKVHLSLTANPSHLESVNAVVQGQVRAKQVLKGDDFTKSRIAPILIHGDASLAGQGVVYEAMQMCRLPGYAVGGTIHIVINNQIGFTTLPKDARSTRYCTDLARAFSAPVFHVNGEDVEACAFAAILAIELRQKFQCDVFIDINCYRKYGHNEGDEPAFTQPLEYQMIRKKKGVREIYRDDLIQQGVLERKMALALEQEFKSELQSELDEIQTFKTRAPKDTATPQWKALRDANWTLDPFSRCETGVPAQKLQQLAARFCDIPEGFSPHRKIKRLAEDRLKMVQGGALNWGMAEHLAFATLLDEGTHVRVSGQDSRRGTFNHRHAMWMDQEKEWKYFPLNHLKEGQGRFDIFNSPLSEVSDLGFEFGYSLSYPTALVIWEAQFGDFANSAQVIIDQYISTSEQKWARLSSLTMLLPHGYEGQGPEHSSARIERYLQLCGDQNMIVANPTTPAQIFHLLRRQVVRVGLKPLIVFTPKGLFGSSHCVSQLEDLTTGTFEEILDDPSPPSNPKLLVVCSGRIFYDLMQERDKRGADVAIVRIEQLYPFCEKRFKEIMQKYSGFTECIWAQEEPANMGAWDHMRPILRDLLPKEPLLAGRERKASPATGSTHKHKQQQASIMDQVYGS